MFSKIKSLFKNENNPEAPQSDFKHPEIHEGDASQCPFMSKQNKTTNENPVPKQNTKKKNADDSETESQPEEKPRGGCPFMASSGPKKNPNLGIEHSGFDEPFVSKFKYYLSENKINLDILQKGKQSAPIIRQKFNKYPIYLRHTLFFQGEDYKKVRTLECCSRFLAYEDLRERGNKNFNKGRYLKALDYYERAMSLFRWLQHKQPEAQPTMGSQQQIEDVTSQSQISEDETLSKIPINLGEKLNFMKPQKNEEFEKFKNSHMQFFTIYHDENTLHFNGEQMPEAVDIDMRKSLLIQIYLNMAATYIKLNHFSLAYQALEDAAQLSDKVSQILLRSAQVALANKSSTLEELKTAQQKINKAIVMQPEEKIYKNTNPNILKMVNIHDAKQVYQDVSQKLTERISQYENKKQTLKSSMTARLSQINEIEKNMIKQGRTPIEGDRARLLSEGTDFKILRRMFDKYIRVMQFFTEAKDKKQIGLAKNQFQEVLRVINEVSFIESIEIDISNPEFGENQEKIENRLKNIKRQKCQQIYNDARYNFQVLEWAIKEIVNEQHELKVQKQKREKQQLQKNTQQNQNSQKVQQKGNFLNKLPYVMLIVPVIGIAVNFLI